MKLKIKRPAQPTEATEAPAQSVQLAISEAEFMEPICALHRGKDSIVGLMRKTDRTESGMENIGALKVDEIPSMLPPLVEFLLHDAYMTVNGYNGRGNTGEYATGLPRVWRREKNLRYLNALYADLDIGRAGAPAPAGLSVSHASQLLIDLLTGGTLPQLSMSAQSGQGLYVFWLIRDDDDENAPFTFQSQAQWLPRLALYKRINKAIQARLKCLAADTVADGARVLRVPGTTHYKTGAKCFYKVTYDSQGKLVTYTLRELAEAFDVPIMATSLPRELYQSKGTHPKRANGAKSLGMARARELVTLEQWRGGWTKGWTADGRGRRWHLREYAQFLQAAGGSFDEILEAVKAMASNCKPPYPSDANDISARQIVREVISSPFTTRSQFDLARWLQVTPDEVEQLSLQKLAPPTPKEEMPRGGKRAVEAAMRREALQTLIAERGTGRGLPSEREFEAALQAQGIGTSRATINRDLSAMGYQSHPSRQKAGRKSSQDLPLPELE